MVQTQLLLLTHTKQNKTKFIKQNLPNTNLDLNIDMVSNYRSRRANTDDMEEYWLE